MNKSIVLTVCEELKITPNEFFGPARNSRLTRARRIAIKRFLEAGFTKTATARMIKRTYRTVQYWTNPAIREHKKEYCRRVRASRKQAA